MNARICRFASLSVLAIFVAVLLPACQSSTNTPAEPAASERTSVVAKYTIYNTEPQKQADSATWMVGQSMGAGIVPVLDARAADKITYAANLSLAAPLGSQSLTLALWKCGVRIIRLSYTAGGATNELTLVAGTAQYDGLALRLFDTLNARGEALARSKLVDLYASWLLVGDEKALAFPDSLPVGLVRQEVVQAVLVAASKTGAALASQAKAWSLDLSADSARILTLQLISDKRIPSSDSSKLFPPPTIRVDAPLSVTAGLDVGGAPVAIHGSFGWNAGLGPVTFRSRVLSGTEIVASSSITTSALPAPSGVATHASLDSAASILIATPLATEGDYRLVVVAQVAGGDSVSSTANFHVGPKAAVQPGVPGVRLYSPVDGSTVPFETRQIATTWVVTTPQGAIDTVTIDGVAAKSVNDSMWSGSVALAPTGKAQTVVLRAHSTSGLSTTQVASFTRLADQTGPVITWVSPAAELEVENGVSSITVRVKATDPSGIDTVLIGGKKPDSLNAAGEWVRKVPLTVTGSPMAIVVRAVDSAKNASNSSMNVTRQNPSTDIPPTVVLASPLAKTGTVVVWDSAFATVRWTITDPYGVDSASVEVNGIKAVSETGDKWSARVPLAATGSPTSIALSVKNRNGVSGGEVISITRRADTTKPVLTVVAGSRNIGYDSAEVTVVCKASDNDSLTSVTIGGLEATKQGDLYVGKLKIEVGDSRYSIVVRDRASNSTSVDVAFHRYQKMSITRLNTSADTTVSASTRSMDLRWKVFGAVTVSGAVPVSSGSKPVPGAYGTSVVLSIGPNVFKLIAADSTGRIDSLTTTITRRAQAALALYYGLDTAGTLPDSVVIAANSEAGAALSWSLNGTDWTPFTGYFAQKLSGTAKVRAQVIGKDDSISSLKAFDLFHANHAPSIALTASSVLAKSYLGKFSAGVAKVTDWGFGDDLQKGIFQVQPFDLADTQFVTGLSVDSQGVLSGTLKLDTSVVVKVRLRVKDNGGISGRGVDTSAWSAWLPIQIVDTVMDPSLNAYRAVRMLDGKVWMRSNMRYQVQIPGEVCYHDTCEKYGVQYSQFTAFNNRNTSAPTKGICPSNWHIAAKLEWTNLFLSNLTEGSSDSLYQLRTPGTWRWSGVQGGGLRDGSGKFGDFVLPNGSYTMYGGELWVWLPSDAQVTPQAVIYGLMSGRTDNAPPAAAVRCLMD